MRPNRSFYLYFIRFPSMVAVILLLGMGIFARRGYLDWRRMVSQNQELSTKLVSVKGQREQLERQISSLANKASAQERLIRQILGFIRPEEIVIEFD